MEISELRAKLVKNISAQSSNIAALNMSCQPTDKISAARIQGKREAYQEILKGLDL